MIRTFLSLRVAPDRVGEVLHMYEAEDILQFSLDHSDAVASEISVAVDGSGDMMVTALWPDEAAYQAWLDHPYRRESAPRLAKILADAEVGPGRICEVRQSVAKDRPQVSGR